MSCTIHFLNVKDGDCTIIQHETERVSVIDICNGNEKQKYNFCSEANFNMRENSINPITYLENLNIKNIFRFILTHPDMDHLDGLENLFTKFTVVNFWDTGHKKDMREFKNSKYKETDWEYYLKVRKSCENPKVLQYYLGCEYDYFMKDGLEIISPNKILEKEILNSKNPNWNEISYVILHTIYDRKILYCGDSEDLAWKYILNNKELHKKIKDIDILIAPHHGRKTGGDKENIFLNELNPKLVLFGNTSDSKHKNYQAFNNRKIPILTNNEAGNIIMEINNKEISIKTENDINGIITAKNYSDGAKRIKKIKENYKIIFKGFNYE
ncbi:putative hydrolase (metallo-beta-lactamase superfamily) [Campylobacter subantarcticus LMG 24377]|uniref:Uncharacterized protein n=1 Tax=Campylobacter subantarcticus TaxID=497724 RepID=A0ABW9N3F0_9BACT|nr:hypothetical protein [Campylobacter subantarcticus]AJC91920.1 putative hydrolase (metallo-beta-lactamase superfamily) [Campylobacter subantarcticus LMG 24377]EAL3939420.1 hypothetical protein [Campylobacter lari]MPB98779.1 hypothetical protein [Campylobacter subantarcticus]